MQKCKLTKEHIFHIIPLLIVFACFVVEKAFKRLTLWNSTSALIQAIVYTAACAVTYLFIMKATDSYIGMISAIFAFKIMPPELDMLQSLNTDAYLVYYIVRKAALVLFAYAIYRHYRSQSKNNNAVELLPILLLLTAVPFFNPISTSLSTYFYMKTQSMLYVYAVQYACYIAPSAILIAAAAFSSKKSALFISDFSIIGLAVNLARKAFSAVLMANAEMRVSKSYFFWIALYAVLIVCFALVRKKKSNIKA